MERGLLKALLLLNGNLPPENAKIWITVEEMRDRLVHCGVHRSVSTDHLVQALTRVNKGEGLLARRREKGTAFYRPSLCHGDQITHIDQRLQIKGRGSRLPVNPEQDYLKTVPAL